MKVGGNESATKYFRANGGSAALASKDPKTKYQSAAATKYKEELKKRAARDALEFPDEVVITDITETESSTPASEPADDFFSSWDKPSIKRPTPPVSRTATPPVVGRTPSPFLNPGANGKDIARSTSPLAKSDSADAKPAASRITHSAALRKTAGTTGPRKTNVLGAKKTTKLGTKKVTGDIIDFDEAEKKAKEEADRIAKLGYDPEAEEAAVKKTSTTKSEASNIASPTPVSPRGYGHSREKSAAEVERLGMGFGRLGFGQVGGGKAAAAAPAPKKNAGGFGSVGPVKATTEGMYIYGAAAHSARYVPVLTGLQTMTRSMPATSLVARRVSPRMSSSDAVPSTPTHSPRPRIACRVSRAPRPSRPMRTSAGLRRRILARITVTWRPRPRTSSASLALPLVTTLRT